MFKIALVVGGTNTKCALFKGNRIVKKLERSTGARKGTKFMISNILDMISEVKGSSKISGIGLGSPGRVNSKTGVVVKYSKFKWKNLPLARIVQKKFKTKVIMENDANCAGLGALKNTKTKNFVLLTLGTGLGGAVVIEGELYKGMGSAGHFGHSTIEKNGFRCTCGNRGCLEEYVAARAFERLARKYFGKKLSPKEIERLAVRNKKAKKIYNEIGRYLGIGLANIANAFNPEIIYFTGKIIRSGSLLLGPARDEMRKRIVVKPPKLKRAPEDSGLYGAVSLLNL
ncbi:MAG: ROK family protein [archaeon]|nr:MAG: ROK family protein [archaeon]